jgi:hypothetical protein
MLTPTTAELFTAIEVLQKLGLRINEQAAHSMIQMPNSNLGGHYAGRIGVNAIEQTTRIEDVVKQLKSWREELQQQRKQHVSQSV